MGSGKTTLGRALDRLTDLQFIDLDELIEHNRQKSITRIFEEAGEEGFRSIERDTLADLCSRTDIIVACGGGTPCFFDNMDRMNGAGITVYLDASHPTLLRRLKEAKSSRPLIAAMDDEALSRFISDSLRRRAIHYRRAAHTFSTDRLEDSEQIEHTAKEFIKRFISHQ